MTTIFNQHLPTNYFSPENKAFVKFGVERLLSESFDKPYTVDDDSINRILHRVLEERLETTEKMLQRAIMYIASEISIFELERQKNLNYEKVFRFTGGIYDNLAKIGPDMRIIKDRNLPSTIRFWHTYDFNFSG